MNPYLYFWGGKVKLWQNPVQALIQFGTDSLYYHVDLEWDRRRNLVVGAHWDDGVQTRNLKNMGIPKGCFIDVYQCEEEISSQLYCNFLSGQIGRKYDKLGVIYLAWLKLRRDHESSNKFQTEKDFFCSELAANALRAGGAKLTDLCLNNVASPADLSRSRSLKKLYRMDKI